MEQTKTWGEEAPRRSLEKVALLRPVFCKAHGVLMSPACEIREPLTLGRALVRPDIPALGEDGMLSRQHARIEPVAGVGARIVDLGSHNGTFVNGERITDAVLADGDVVRLGSSLFVLRFEAIDNLDAALGSLFGRARSMRMLRATLAAAAASNATVVFLGETGTGKTLAARAVHDASGRSGAFVPVNCAAVPETLAESELFGHVAGAFTDAKRDHTGFFRAAERGTLFLDEVGELPPTVQAKLLSAIEDHLIMPVGSVHGIACDVRVVVATNADLEARVQDGTFRADLFARISEIVVNMPRLRERREDILLLFSQMLGHAAFTLDAEIAEALLLHKWPYNVRELAKVATEANVLAQSQPDLARSVVSKRLRSKSADPAPAKDIRPEADATAAASPGSVPTRPELEALLREAKGVVSVVAQRTGRSRKQVYRWLQQLDVDPKNFR